MFRKRRKGGNTSTCITDKTHAKKVLRGQITATFSADNNAAQQTAAADVWPRIFMALWLKKDMNENDQNKFLQKEMENNWASDQVLLLINGICH